MKIFIVTSGSYSDYRINGVSLDRAVADRYAKAVVDSEIEECDLLEDMPPIVVRKFMQLDRSGHAIWGVWNSKDEDEPWFISSLENPNTFDFSSEEITREVPIDADEEGLILKYERVLEDIMAEVKSLRKIEGYSEEQIEAAINAKYNPTPNV